MPCSPPNAFWSIVGQARRQTAGAMGPLTIDRSNLPLGVEGMNVQDGQRYNAGQGAVVTTLPGAAKGGLTPSARPGSRQTVATNWRCFYAVAEPSDERPPLGDRRLDAGQRQR